MVPTRTSKMPSSPAQPFAPVRRTIPPANDDGWITELVQYVAAAFGEPVMRGSRVELRDLVLQVLIDHQQCFQRTAQIAVAAGYDLVDDGFIRSGSHPNFSSFPAGLTSWRPIRAPCG